MKQALWEATKEPLRLLVLAVIPFGIAYFTELPYEWAGIITFLLRYIDKLLHEIGKAEVTKSENNLLIKGLTRF